MAIVIATASPAASSGWLIPPVDGPTIEGFEPPRSAWGSGHRGIDLAAPGGTSVRAAADGTVTFAGRVGAVVAVTLDHGSGLETTYSSLASVTVEAGDRVRTGTYIGTVGVTHQGDSPGVHLGVKRNGVYVDPATFFSALDVGRAVRLIPYEEADPSATRSCAPVAPMSHASAAPNENVAVAVAGIGSRTKDHVSAELYKAGRGPRSLGYRDVYEFSYAGMSGSDLHRPYMPGDTYNDIRHAAAKLRQLLFRIKSLHPRRDVDLLAHSQGGIVARTFLTLYAGEWDPRLPRVDHIVTFSSPHGGAPAAEAGADLDRGLLGRRVNDLVSLWSDGGGPIPDPRSEAVEQLTPGSDLLRALATEDVVYGTKVLALSIPHDAVVPADRAAWRGKASRTVPFNGINGHDGVVTSAHALGLAHAFLRDAPLSCPGGWESTGRALGRYVSFVESRLGEILREPGLPRP